MTLEEAQNKAEAAKALVDEVYHAAFGGELKLDRSIEEVLDIAVDETSEFVCWDLRRSLIVSDPWIC
jgi:hypothetical protein